MCICEVMGNPTQGFWMTFNLTLHLLFLEEETETQGGKITCPRVTQPVYGIAMEKTETF